MSDLMNVWDNLPNSKHIEHILDSLKRKPRAWADAWDAAYDKSYYESWSAEWSTAWDAVSKSGRNELWDAVFVSEREESSFDARDAANDAILGLIAYDDIAHMLDSTPDDLRVLIALGDGRAALMLPAAIVFNEENV